MANKTSLNPESLFESRQMTSLSKVLTTVAALLITIIGIRLIAQDLIAPILLALFYTVLTLPIFRWFRSKGFSSGVSLIMMIITFFASLYFLYTFFNWSFGLIHESLTTYTTNIANQLNQLSQQLHLPVPATPITPDVTPQTINNLASTFINRLSGFIYYFIFIPILAFMILLQIDSLPPEISQKLLQENPGLKRIQKFSDSITLYVVNRFKINLITGLLFSISLIIIGIPYPFVWGISTVILSFVPYIGVVLAGIPPAIIAIGSGNITQALLVFIALFAVDIFAENLLDPYIQGQTNKISMATVVIALIFWSWLLGFIGLIMAVPLTVLLKTVLADYPETRWIASLMEGNYEAPTPPPGKRNRITQFFSRILPHSTQ